MIDLTVFDSLDEIVSELMRTARYSEVQERLKDIYCETERVLACLDKLWSFMYLLSDSETAALLGPAWRTNRTAQTATLIEAYDELLTVATTILPRMAVRAVANQLD